MATTGPFTGNKVQAAETFNDYSKSQISELSVFNVTYVVKQVKITFIVELFLTVFINQKKC